MIRQLTGSDHRELMNYVLKEPELNLFIIGDVENYGYETDFQRLWGEFDDSGKISAVLLKYYENFVFYSRDDFNVEGFYEIISSNGFNVMSGSSEILRKFSDMACSVKKRDTFFCRLDKMVTNGEGLPLEKVQWVAPNNMESSLDGIIKLYGMIKEFEVPTEKHVLKKAIEDNTGRCCFIEEDGEVVAVVQSTAENSRSAMVVGVSTHPGYRKKGYASACVYSLCKELNNQGKSLCLFYDNPEAGKIYKRLGFRDIDTWAMWVN